MVHKLIMEDFSSRKNVKTSQEYGKDGAAKLFKENLGNYYTIQDFKNLVDNNKTVNDFPAEIKAKIHDILNGNGDEINLPAPDVSSITDEQKKAFEKRDRRKMTFYLDPDIPKELATAEQLYEFFMELHRKASKKFGPGVADAIFQIGDTLDEHFDTDVAEEELSKRLYDAQQFAKSQNAGKSPAGIDGELDRLNEPVLRWQDKVRSTVRRITSGNEKCDYSRFKTKHLLLLFAADAITGHGHANAHGNGAFQELAILESPYLLCQFIPASREPGSELVKYGHVAPPSLW
jgi:hypothetical protein